MPTPNSSPPSKSSIIFLNGFGAGPAFGFFNSKSSPPPLPLNRQRPQLLFHPAKPTLSPVPDTVALNRTGHTRIRLLCNLIWAQFARFNCSPHKSHRVVPRRATQSSTMSSPVPDNSSLLARHYIDYVYAPGLLLVVGTLIVKKEWTPYAALIAVLFGIYNFMAFRKLCQIPCFHCSYRVESSTISNLMKSQRSRRLLSPMSSRTLSLRRRPLFRTMSPCKPPTRPPKSNTFGSVY